MHWIVYFVLSLPIAVLGLLGGGFLGNACVRWYRVSSFEGGSGYFVMGLGLLGAVVGLVTGLVTAGVMAPQNGAAFLKTFGVSVGALALIAATAIWLCWALADIPPEIEGCPLRLEVELRLPVDVTDSPAKGVGESSLTLSSVMNHRARKSQVGELKPARARLENGRWIVPGAVELFTMRGKRSIGFKLNGKEIMGYLVPLPARPGKKFLEWSDWGPRPPAPQPAWPDTKPSYRFRVQKIGELPAEPTREEALAQTAAQEQANFEAVPADAPITKWFPYLRDGVSPDRRAIAIAKLTAKPTLVAELKGLMLGGKAERAAEAMRLIEQLPNPSRDLLAPVTAAGRDLAKRLRKVNATTAEEDPSDAGAADVAIRFRAWMVAVRTLRERAGGDFTPELKTILELSRVRSDSRCLRADVCRVASFYLKEWTGLEPLPGDPKPR